MDDKEYYEITNRTYTSRRIKKVRKNTPSSQKALFQGREDAEMLREKSFKVTKNNDYYYDE